MMKFKIIIGLLLSIAIFINCTGNQQNNCDSSNFKLVQDYDDLNLNLKIAFDDFGATNKCANELNKPILTIYGCYGCIGYQKGVWEPLADEEINSILREEFLIRYYHVDDRAQLPDSILTESLVSTVGEYFRAKQMNRYKINSQPFYTITDWEENDLADPIGYVSKAEIDKFIGFINEGKTNYAKKYKHY